MPTPTYPLFIQGPCIITRDSKIYRSKGDVKVDLKRSSFTVETAQHGPVATRHKSQYYEITWQPAGEIISAADFAKYFPYNPGVVGSSIFGAVDVPTVILALNGQQHTYHRTGVSKCPSLMLSALQTIFQGEMGIYAIQKGDVLTAAAAIKTLATQAFADTGFDQTKLKTARYLATWGATYTNMIARAGFKIELNPTIELDEVDGYGIVDGTLKGVVALASFSPANLTEAEVDALMAVQDAGVILPGEDYSKDGNDLVIADEGGTIVSIALKNAGPKDFSQVFGGKHRHGDIGFVTSRTWTAGTANPLLTFTFPV